MGGGVGLLDYDGDGWLDVYCRPGRRRSRRGPTPADGDRLFRNRGDGTFEDATEAAGPRRASPAATATASRSATIDNDGRPDLFVTRWRSYALYRNRGDGTFEDATEAAGLGGDRDWPTSAAFADLDGDGDLDLYVCHYLAWDAEHPRSARSLDTPGPSYCDPRTFRAVPDRLFRNDGGRFVDVTEEAGIVDRDGRGLGVVAADLDGDGRVDLYVANDMTANFLFRNRGGLRFEESAATSGRGRRRPSGGYQAGMGVACGDLDGDGRPDLAVTNFYGESTTLYRNLGGGFFADRTAAVGLAAPSRYRSSASASPSSTPTTTAGSTWPPPTATSTTSGPTIPYAMPAQLLSGPDGGRSSTSHRGSARPGESPGSAAGWPSATSTTTAGSTS